MPGVIGMSAAKTPPVPHDAAACGLLAGGWIDCAPGLSPELLADPEISLGTLLLASMNPLTLANLLKVKPATARIMVAGANADLVALQSERATAGQS